MSAAVGYETGQICMQRALAITTIDAKATIKVSEAMLALAEASQDAAKGGDSADLANVAASLKQTATLLTTSTERTTFLDLGMFYLCQISANGGLTDTQTAELVKIIAISGSSINTSEMVRQSKQLTQCLSRMGSTMQRREYPWINSDCQHLTDKNRVN
ncbi:hypothetical protein EKK97_10930 [Billgrantia tianxiuensis]|jgi:hypothetical protein|uniref:Uncharacterized protein n=1 Tax=Billgrantia tianxiuensis TaxID=2497861 RepID=A0A6I6SKE1_9GAMM|nr:MULTISPECIES: hypothetical protein [Halomonas]MCE8031913.1 hypothetical protein [Halomonas sp. MCCC 1A11057]QHC50012.1 hypothetical protein EKK97_10930 [Halomonas tianxiuensis]